MNFNVGLEHKRQNAMWYVPYRDKSKAASMEKNEKKMETIAHGKWKGERFAFLKITGKNKARFFCVRKVTIA